MNKFSENLKKIRKDNNLSQEDLADKLNVSRQAISKWESGSAYPEMDKIILICKMFDVNIDDLLNKDINDVKNEKDGKSNLSKYMDDFLKFIENTIDMFSHINFKTAVKCLFEMLILLGISSLILKIIGGFCEGALEYMLNAIFPYKITNGIIRVLTGIYGIFSAILILIILVYMFKKRYLDYYEKSKKEEIKKEDKDTSKEKKEDDKKENIEFNKKEEKIIIRDPENSEYKFIDGLYKIFILIAKFFATILLIASISALIGFILSFVLSFLIIHTGYFFIGLLLCFVSLIITTIIITILLLNFIFDRKNNKKAMILTFLISIILFGISCGLIALGALKFDIVDKLDKDVETKETIQVDMSSKLLLNSYTDFEYIEKDIDNIIIEYTTLKGCSVNYYITKEEDIELLHYYPSCSNALETFRSVLKEINKKKIINIDEYFLKPKVYANKDNIEKLKQNKIKYDKLIENLE